MGRYQTFPGDWAIRQSINFLPEEGYKASCEYEDKSLQLFNMIYEDPGNVSHSALCNWRAIYEIRGGINKVYYDVYCTLPKGRHQTIPGALLYGRPDTEKTLLARNRWN